MAEVIPASGDDWREIERRASLPDGHIERALLEILQRLVPVENQVVPVGAAGADHVPDAGKMVAPTPTAAPAGGVTEEEMRRVLADSVWALESDCERREVTNCLFSHPRIGPLLRGEGAAAPKRVVLPEKPPMTGLYWVSHDYRDGYRDCWAAARAEVARQQGEAV